MRTLLIAGSFVALVGCSSSTTRYESASTSSAASADPTSFCSTLCTRTAACDSSVDVDTCTKKCASDAALSGYRSDMLDAVASCFQAADCKQVLSDDGLTSCVDDASVSIAPTDSTRSFCASFQTAATKCDSPIDHAKCLELAKVYSDDTLASATRCFDKSCSTMGSCLDAELGD